MGNSKRHHSNKDRSRSPSRKKERRRERKSKYEYISRRSRSRSLSSSPKKPVRNDATSLKMVEELVNKRVNHELLKLRSKLDFELERRLIESKAEYERRVRTEYETQLNENEADNRSTIEQMKDQIAQLEKSNVELNNKILTMEQEFNQERLDLLERLRISEEAKRNIENEFKKAEKQSQNMILNSKIRPKVSFGLKKTEL